MSRILKLHNYRRISVSFFFFGGEAEKKYKQANKNKLYWSSVFKEKLKKKRKNNSNTRREIELPSFLYLTFHFTLAVCFLKTWVSEVNQKHSVTADTLYLILYIISSQQQDVKTFIITIPHIIQRQILLALLLQLSQRKKERWCLYCKDLGKPCSTLFLPTHASV